MAIYPIPRPIWVAQLSLEIALVFAVMMSTDLATAGYAYYYYNRIYTVHKVFIYLLCMATITRCFTLIGLACQPRKHRIKRASLNTSPCPFKRIMRVHGAFISNTIMLGIWITVVILEFDMGNFPAAFLSVAMLVLQCCSAVCAIVKLIKDNMGKDRDDSHNTDPACSRQPEYQSIGPMFLPRYRDGDAADAEDGHRRYDHLGRVIVQPADARPMREEFVRKLGDDGGECRDHDEDNDDDRDSDAEGDILLR